jgi:Ca-activated chloride channel family protein
MKQSNNNSSKAFGTAASPNSQYLDRPNRDWLTFGMSFAFHLILMVAIFFLSTTFGGGGGENEPERVAGIVLSVRDAAKDQPEYLDASDTQPIDQPAEPASAQAAESTESEEPPALPASAASPKIALPGFDFNQTNDAAQMATPRSNTGAAKPYQLSDADKEIIAADQAYFNSLKPTGPATSISVFGSGQLEGRSFVFLLDRSKSMGSGGLGVLDIAGTELTKAVGNLKPHHTFQILGYNSKTTPLKARRLLAATNEHKTAVPKFIQNMVAFGKTEHEFALMAAISYRPDVIVLLSDGDDFGNMSDVKLKKIRQTLRGAAQIHCVQFGLGPAKAAVGFMQKLASQNGGTFRYVDVNQWRR